MAIRNGSDEMVCKADTESDVTLWVDAITAAIKENARRREMVMEARAARGEVCRQGRRDCAWARGRSAGRRREKRLPVFLLLLEKPFFAIFHRPMTGFCPFVLVLRRCLVMSEKMPMPSR